MFLNEQFVEAKSGQVEIKHMSPPNLQKLIDFIYKGEVNLLVIFLLLQRGSEIRPFEIGNMISGLFGGQISNGLVFK